MQHNRIFQLTGFLSCVLWLAGATSSLQAQPPGPCVSSTPPPILELLGRPTDRSITLSVYSDHDLTLFIVFGAAPEFNMSSTDTFEVAANEPVQKELRSLLADRRYLYRCYYRQDVESDFLPGPEHTFHTQRRPGQPFVFDIQADSHLYDKKCNTDLYRIALDNMTADQPDFLIDLGDTFGDDHDLTIGPSEMDRLHLDQLPYLASVGQSSPLFLCLGNHEGEMGFYLDGTMDNFALYGSRARKKYYPNPLPNGFYSGNNTQEAYLGYPENYYAWEWGDALFVVLDVYRYVTASAKPRGWEWTLGDDQYRWFEKTLRESHAAFKFVFAHHVLGQTRGGACWALFYEWGGCGGDGKTWEFDLQRPGWGVPLHQLMAQNGVTIFFQGHDHLYAREELDGVIYQECPMPSDATYAAGAENADTYNGTILQNSGHLRVTVSDSNVIVDYVLSLLPVDETPSRKNHTVAHSYIVRKSATAAIDRIENGLRPPADFLLRQNYPNPFNPETLISFSLMQPGWISLSVYNLRGQKVKTLVAAPLNAGEHAVRWDGTDDGFKRVVSGVYGVVLQSNAGQQIRKVVLTR